MKVSIIGLGWVGASLAQSLVAHGHSVSGTTRDSSKVLSLQNLGIKIEILDQKIIPSEELLNCDVCLLNIPPFEDQLEWFKKWPWNKKTHLIFLSSTSVYGELEGIVTEATPLTPSTIKAKELVLEEEWIQSHFSNHTILRLSGLVGEDRHPGKSLAGRKDLKGQNHPVNLIYREDVISFIQIVMDQKLVNEVFNVSSNESRTKKGFYQSFAKTHGLDLPIFNTEDLSQGKRVSNEKLKRIYTLKFSTIP